MTHFNSSVIFKPLIQKPKTERHFLVNYSADKMKDIWLIIHERVLEWHLLCGLKLQNKKKHRTLQKNKMKCNVISKWNTTVLQPNNTNDWVTRNATLYSSNSGVSLQTFVAKPNIMLSLSLSSDSELWYSIDINHLLHFFYKSASAHDLLTYCKTL